jgi:hypothetical protein
MAEPTTPVGLDPTIRRREIVVEADAVKLEKMRKEGHVRGFTVYCDEGAHVGGDNTAPAPLGYLALSLAF